jgi:hypothetical protein
MQATRMPIELGNDDRRLVLAGCLERRGEQWPAIERIGLTGLDFGEGLNELVALGKARQRGLLRFEAEAVTWLACQCSLVCRRWRVSWWRPSTLQHDFATRRQVNCYVTDHRHMRHAQGTACGQAGLSFRVPTTLRRGPVHGLAEPPATSGGVVRRRLGGWTGRDRRRTGPAGSRD